MKKVDRNIYRKKIIYISVFVLFNIVLLLAAMLGSSIINTITFMIGILLIGHFLYNNTKLYLLYYCIFSLCFLFVDLLVSYFISFAITYDGFYFSSLAYLQINNTKLYLLYYCIFSLCFLFVDLLVSYFISFAITYDGFYFSSLAYLQITVIFLLRIIEYVYIKLFTNFINRREAKVINKLQSFTFLVIPLFSAIYILTLVYLLQLYAGFEESILLVVNIILVLILNIYVTHIFDAISKNNTLKNEVKLYHQQSELQHRYYDNLENKYKESRKLIHDIRNHLQSNIIQVIGY